jgi:hypothetical protein
MRDTGWFKSTYSGTANDNCVEVRFTGTAGRVRDSKSPDSVLSVNVHALMNAIRSGRLGA